ncbi:MAG: hypothetical protein Q8S73_25685 [Deltaproteobacteria bacterium]|nr:hypothetical protein [Deltaproteobacteria bacterium]
MMPVESPEFGDGRVRKRATFPKMLTIGAATLVAVLSLGVVSGGIPILSGISSLPSQAAVRLADFGDASPSPEARHVADWVADSRDNANAEFIVVDKRAARVYVFDADARLRGASPVLLGAAPGDDSVPGIGTRPIEEVRPEERTTPAGRFVAERGRNLKGEDVVWVDYDAAISMHRVRATKPSERRLERLATSTVGDNRISYGCINVPVTFYEAYVSPTVATQRAIVYVLPEIKPVQQVFGSYDVIAPRRLASLKLK